jgi:hypothetical protein
MFQEGSTVRVIDNGRVQVLEYCVVSQDLKSKRLPCSPSGWTDTFFNSGTVPQQVKCKGQHHCAFGQMVFDIMFA